MEDSFDVKQDLAIDEHQLDREWLNQSPLYMRYAERAAQARKEYDYSCLSLDVTTAKTERAVRDNPEQFGLAKTTEKAIEAAVKSHEDVITAQREKADARFELSILDAAVNSFEMRKRALENLVTLHGRSYYSEPVDDGKQGDAGRETRTRTTRRRTAHNLSKGEESNG